MSDEVVNILAGNIANQAITIAKQQSEINQLKSLLVKANENLEKNKEVIADEHTNSNARNGQK
ncbi:MULTISPECIES: hypothetical protein [unclassified Lactobacillus]|uniref:hypothetical protein n=1 Tax=unclassified Lactobacillus TaxID=2620435 RepID=UPI002269A4BD|nr:MULTISPECIES: hypothetical protein [unclassified Lactobacillus]MCX8721217.1 hypothetical protein [Lactobacillus sp. B4010]MCX8731957.1 hypothetical protein [Lactobacillus sp. B4015]MCX8734356.1 hypothetical protein [Lactobacillus sp. B4012]